MREHWKPIPGYGGHYEASNLGKIRCKKRIVNKFSSIVGRVIAQLYRKRLLSLIPNSKSGYLYVHLEVDGLQRNVTVHSLVLTAFKGAYPAGLEACHNNGKITDNRASNLRWDTHLSNMADRRKHQHFQMKKYKISVATT